jgi:hypothetical protein
VSRTQWRLTVALAAHRDRPSEDTRRAVRAAADAHTRAVLGRRNGRLAWLVMFDPEAKSLLEVA